MIYDSGCVLLKIYLYLDSTGLTIKIKAIKLQTLITKQHKTGSNISGERSWPNKGYWEWEIEYST